MTSLTLFKQDGIELVIDQIGECFYPGYNALARVCSIGLDKLIYPAQIKRTVESVLETVTDFVILEAEILTTQGLRTVTLIPRKLGTRVIKKHNFTLYEEMADAGHLVFLHQLAGYKVTSTAVESRKPTEEEIRKYLSERVLAFPTRWECRFPPKFWKALKDNYGLEQTDKGCAPFINAYIYSIFPPEVRIKLDIYNPCFNGNRSNKQHQHLETELITALIEQITQVTYLLQWTRTPYNFKMAFDDMFNPLQPGKRINDSWDAWLKRIKSK